MIQIVTRNRRNEFNIPETLWNNYRDKNRLNSIVLGDEDNKNCWALCRIKEDRYIIDHLNYDNEEGLICFLSELDDKSKSLNGKYLEIRVHMNNIELLELIAGTCAFTSAISADDENVYCFYN